MVRFTFDLRSDWYNSRSIHVQSRSIPVRYTFQAVQYPFDTRSEGYHRRMIHVRYTFKVAWYGIVKLCKRRRIGWSVNNSKKMQMVKMVSENAGGVHRRRGWPVKNKGILLCNICNFRHGRQIVWALRDHLSSNRGSYQSVLCNIFLKRQFFYSNNGITANRPGV